MRCISKAHNFLLFYIDILQIVGTLYHPNKIALSQHVRVIQSYCFHGQCDEGFLVPSVKLIRDFYHMFSTDILEAQI